MLLQFVLASFKDEFWVVRSSSLLNVLYLTLAKIGEKIHSYISEIHYEINYCMEKPNNITVLVMHCIKHCMGCTVFFLSCQVWIHQRARLACHIQPSNVLFFVLMALHWTLYTCIFFFHKFCLHRFWWDSQCHLFVLLGWCYTFSLVNTNVGLGIIKLFFWIHPTSCLVNVCPFIINIESLYNWWLFQFFVALLFFRQ